MAELFDYVVEKLGDVINGVIQAVISFLNVVIDTIPNPDPFPVIIQNLDVSTAGNLGFGFYWLDTFVGIDTTMLIITAWVGLMVASAVFAAVYTVTKNLH